jgi:hypothetical protein
MEPSPEPSAERVLAEGHYAVAGHRTLEATGAGPGFHLGLPRNLFADVQSGRS